jgi:hypothetical protein
LASVNTQDFATSEATASSSWPQTLGGLWEKVFLGIGLASFLVAALGVIGFGRDDSGV